MLYDLFLFFTILFFVPLNFLRQKYRGTLLFRLGFRLPPESKNSSSIWIHMVSLGEAKAIRSLFERLKKANPKQAIFLSFCTKTGYEEGKKNLLGADGYFYLPFDFSFLMRRIVRRFKPSLLILSEGDFWPNMLSEVKKKGGKITLVNGKISLLSSKRFAKFSQFSLKLFKNIDLFCVQNQEYAHRFSTLCVPHDKIKITGNLKLSIPMKKLTPRERRNWQRSFKLEPSDRIITIGSTHTGEEKLLLPHLRGFKILLIPRHPERFAEVKKLLNDFSYTNVTLVEEMGILTFCYQLSQVSIVGGSFLPGIGGHNIFEPVQAGNSVIFGPYIEKQKDLAALVLEKKWGIQTPAEGIGIAVEKAFHFSSRLDEEFFVESMAPLERTWKLLQPYLLS